MLDDCGIFQPAATERGEKGLKHLPVDDKLPAVGRRNSVGEFIISISVFSSPLIPLKLADGG